NIYRSPIAEAVMRKSFAKLGLQNHWHVDSAAIESWHLGDKPDPRALGVLSKHGIEYQNCARLLVSDDFKKFDYIFGMDQSDMASLRQLIPSYSNTKLLLLSDFLFTLQPRERLIEDPHYNMGEAPFEKIFDQCSHACLNFLKQARLNEIW
ncbi:primo-2, partial [Drosophila busckii]